MTALCACGCRLSVADPGVCLACVADRPRQAARQPKGAAADYVRPLHAPCVEPGCWERRATGRPRCQTHEALRLKATRPSRAKADNQPCAKCGSGPRQPGTAYCRPCRVKLTQAWARKQRQSAEVR